MQSGASLFGKLPSELDFVRIAHDCSESIALERFMQSALQRLAANRQHWPDEGLAFVMVGTSAHALIGILTGSRDRAGRHYPLAIYTRLPLRGRTSAALPLACERFIERAAELCARSPTLPVAPLRAALRTLVPPSKHDLALAEARLSCALEGGVASAALALYPSAPDPLAVMRGTLRQLGTARARCGSRIDGFSYPAQTLSDISVWAAALERLNGEHSPVSALWRAGAPRSVLLAPGPLPERALLYAAQPTTRHPRLCRAEAAALDTLPGLSEPACTMGQLVDHIARTLRSNNLERR